MLFKITAFLQDKTTVVYYFKSGRNAAIKKRRLEELSDTVVSIKREMVFNRGQKTGD